ncbi:MAG: DinB family protein [Acidobacteriota bacterium]
MRPIERLLDQLNRAYGGEAWHGLALRQLLEDVTEEEARAHPIAGTHSIAELVAHIRATMDMVSERLAGTPRELTTEEDWSDATRTSWPAALEELDNAESRVSDAVARLTPEDLDRLVAGKDYTVYVMIHGVIQHNLYHAGQIALLKKTLATR